MRRRSELARADDPALRDAGRQDEKARRKSEEIVERTHVAGQMHERRVGEVGAEPAQTRRGEERPWPNQEPLPQRQCRQQERRDEDEAEDVAGARSDGNERGKIAVDQPADRPDDAGA